MDEGEQVVSQESPSGSIPEAPVITPEAIREYLKAHPEEVEPEVSRRVDQGISKINERRRKEEQEREAHRAEDRQIKAYVESVPEEQRWRLDPRVLDRYHKAESSQNAGPDNEEAVNRRLQERVGEIWSKAKSNLKDHPEYGADLIDWDSLDTMELPDAITTVAHAKAQKEKRRMDEEMKKELDAMEARLRAALHITSSEPDVVPGGVVGSNTGGSIRERYRTGTAQDRAELRKEYGERLDDILNG